MCHTGVFVGLSTLDVIQLVDRLPGANEKVVALDMVTAAGGPAANAAVAFAALGGRPTLVTRVGNDPAGELVISELTSRGVKVINASSDTPTVVASIMVTAGTGERAVVSAADSGRSWRGGESDFGGGLLDEIKPEVLVVDSYETDISIPMARQAKQHGIPVLLDVGSKKAWTMAQLPHTDMAVVSSDYLPGGAMPIVEDLFGAGVPNGAITAGADPIIYWLGGKPRLYELPVLPIEVVDTLGAGDFFHGVLAFFIAEAGLSKKNLERGLLLATSFASISVKSFGSRAWLRNLRGNKI